MRFLRQLFLRLGYLVISKKTLSKYSPAKLNIYFGLEQEAIPYLESTLNGGIREKLIQEGKTRWLEIGCGGTFEKFFTYLDLFPETLVNKKRKYHRIDITNLKNKEVENLGKFDLIRMQHVFEHFTPEDGLKVLDNCAELLKTDGYILITTPDLKKYVNLYLSGTIRNNFEWAHKRINSDSPNSFYFSVYTHSMRYEEHKWCYDVEGLMYQLNMCGKFKNIIEIKLGDELSNIPFTHNRPNEDVCVIGQLK